jgi:hypothetical protein
VRPSLACFVSERKWYTVLLCWPGWQKRIPLYHCCRLLHGNNGRALKCGPLCMRQDFGKWESNFKMLFPRYLPYDTEVNRSKLQLTRLEPSAAEAKHITRATSSSNKLFPSSSVLNVGNHFDCNYSVMWNLNTRYNWLTLWNSALLERPPVVRPLDSFPAFYGTRSFITEFTRSLHLFLSRARPIQSTSPYPTSPRSILILSIDLHLGERLI